MRMIYRCFLLYVTTVHGFSPEEVSSLIDCLSTCSNELCQEACNDLISEINLYPQVDEDAGANVSLHCTGENRMMIKFNPGIYIVEQSTSEHAWSFAKITKGSFARLTNLTAGTNYRFRLYKLMKEGVSRPEMTEWFSTYEVDYEPLPVKNISLVKLEVDKKSDCHLRAEIAFVPAEDYSCSYNVYAWYGEHNLLQFDLTMMPDFQFKLKCLAFDQSNTVSISSVNKDNTKANERTSITFYTPTCLEYYNNITICAPDKVEGLRAEHMYHYGHFYDLQISWNRPEQEPDNYTVQVELLRNESAFYITHVPGNMTEATFLDLELEPAYEVIIVADSLGGTSLSTSIIKTVVSEHATTVQKSYRDLIIGITIAVTIVVLIGMVCLQYYKQRNKDFTIECTGFDGLNQKDSSIETTKKLLPQDYESEVNSAPLIHDKFEVNSKLLKLKCVLGSGAYGIVRLGSLQDEFGNTNDVAVKMLKDDPRVEDIQNFHKEIVIMKFAGQHPNIVSLIGCCTLHNKPALVVEYCCKGDLQTYLRKIWQSMISVAFKHRARFKFDANSFVDSGIEHLSNNFGEKVQNYQNIKMITNRLYDIQQDVQFTETVTPNNLLNFARQIATGMEFLSSNRIVHRDLAARNILVCEDGVVKISDFGLSRDIYQENLYRKQGNGKLPLKWMAIEALTHQIYTTHTDVWSFGILLWEIVTMGAVPYPGIPTNAVLKLLKSGYRMERPPSCSTQLYDFMLSCWNVRPQSRPTFTQLKESLDYLLSCQSCNKYLNMEEILHDVQDQYRLRDE